MKRSWQHQEFSPSVIPDLDLPQYAGTEATSFRSVLDGFDTLLPVLHAMCIGYRARLQLLLQGGAKSQFQSSILVSHQNESPIPIRHLLDASLVGRVFRSETEIDSLRPPDVSARLNGMANAVEITRSELEFELGQTGAHHTDRKSIYSTAAWKAKRHCRLNMTFSLMDTLPERSAILLSLTPIDDQETESLRLSTLEQIAIANRHMARDVEDGKKRLSRLLRSGPERRLEKIVEDVLSFPCFRMGMRVFGESISTARIIEVVQVSGTPESLILSP